MRKADSIRAMKIHERIKPHFGVVLLFCLCFGAASHAQKPTASDQLVLSNVTVVDVRTGALHAEQTVVLEGNRIASVEPSKSAKHPRNAPIVNSRGSNAIAFEDYGLFRM